MKDEGGVLTALGTGTSDSGISPIQTAFHVSTAISHNPAVFRRMISYGQPMFALHADTLRKTCDGDKRCDAKNLANGHREDEAKVTCKLRFKRRAVSSGLYDLQLPSRDVRCDATSAAAAECCIRNYHRTCNNRSMRRAKADLSYAPAASRLENIMPLSKQ